MAGVAWSSRSGWPLEISAKINSLLPHSLDCHSQPTATLTMEVILLATIMVGRVTLTLANVTLSLVSAWSPQVALARVTNLHLVGWKDAWN